MWITGKNLLLMVLLAGPASAQRLVSSTAPATPAPAMSGPAYEVSSGYTSLAMPIPGAGQVHLNGLDASGSIEWNPRWGATLDTNYLRSSSVPGTAHQAYLLNLQLGPQFCAFDHRNTRLLVRALGGSALVDGAAPDNKTGFYHGWLVRPSLAIGAGVEQSLSRQFAVRINADYLRTSFYDASGAVSAQDNLRLSLNITFRKARAGRLARAW